MTGARNRPVDISQEGIDVQESCAVLVLISLGLQIFSVVGQDKTNGWKQPGLTLGPDGDTARSWVAKFFGLG